MRLKSHHSSTASSSTPTIAAIPIPTPAPPEMEEPEEVDPLADWELAAEDELAGGELSEVTVELEKKEGGILEES